MKKPIISYFRTAWDQLKQVLHQNWHYILVIIFGLIVSLGVWGSINTYIIGDDFAFHIERLQGATHALQDGQLFMQVDPNGMYGFGYAYNLFYGPLLTWLIMPLRFLVGSWPVAINLLCIIFMLLAGILGCYALTKISKHKTLGAICGTLYMTAPYHLVNLYVRFALAEFVGMAFLPLLLLGLYQLVNHQEHALRNLAVSATLLLLTHNLMTFLAVIMVILYLLLNWRAILDWGSIKKMLLTGLIALGGAACFLLPMFEAKLVGDYGIFDPDFFAVRVEANAKRMEDRHAPLSELLSFEYNNSWETTVNLGIGVISIIGLIGFWFTRRAVKDRSERKFLTSLYVIAIISLVLTTSLINWHLLPSFFYAVQFPWRFLALFSITISVIASYVIYELICQASVHRQKLYTVIIGVFATFVVMDIFALQPDLHVTPDVPVDLSPVNGNAGWAAEYAPMALLCADDSIESCTRERALAYLEARGKNYIVREGEAKVTNYQQNGTNISFNVDTESSSIIELPLIWYPGYQARLDRTAKLETTASAENGLVIIRVPAGLSNTSIKLSYCPTTMTILGFSISALTCIVTLGWPLWRKLFLKTTISSKPH